MTKDFAVVIKIGNRYFYGFGKNGQVKTAFYVAGARLFVGGMTHDSKLIEIEKKLQDKKKKYSISKLVEVFDA